MLTSGGLEQEFKWNSFLSSSLSTNFYFVLFSLRSYNLFLSLKRKNVLVHGRKRTFLKVMKIFGFVITLGGGLICVLYWFWSWDKGFYKQYLADIKIGNNSNKVLEQREKLWCDKESPEKEAFIQEYLKDCKKDKKAIRKEGERDEPKGFFNPTCDKEGAQAAYEAYLWCPNFYIHDVVGKPVIYLYPQQTQEVKVQLDYQWKIIADYPTYDENIKGWEVIAHPDSILINKADGKEYSYLFREGMSANPRYDLSKGFVVKGSDTRAFLQEKLAEIWLTPKEYNEFIVYRYPKMMDNPYNLISFAGEEYTKTAPLTITPQPDSILRVFMVYKALQEPIEIPAQTFEPFERKGFSVVERWGTEL